MANKRNKRRRVSFFSTMLSITLVLLMFGALGLVLINARKIHTHLKENVQVQLLFREDAKEAEIMRWKNELEMAEFTRSVRLVSKDDAKERMVSDLGDDFVELLGYNPLPYSIDLKLKEEFVTPERIKQIKAEIEDNPIIREFYYQAEMVEAIDKNLNLAILVLLGASLVFLVIAVALINSTIRLTLYSKRFLIKSMQLVGATRAFIRKPFVLTSVINGIIAALLANLLLFGGIYYVNERIDKIILLDDPMLMALLFAAVVGLGLAISAVSSYFAINKYLRLKLDELY